MQTPPIIYIVQSRIYKYFSESGGVALGVDYWTLLSMHEELYS